MTGFRWFQLLSEDFRFELNFQTCIVKNYFDENLLVLVLPEGPL